MASSDPVFYKGARLHHHPSRIALEKNNRKDQSNESQYNPFAGPFDITLLRLDRDVEFIPEKIAPICLFGLDYSGFKYGYVAGFGSLSFAHNCWTSKDGPNAFSECKEVMRSMRHDRSIWNFSKF